MHESYIYALVKHLSQIFIKSMDRFMLPNKIICKKGKVLLLNSNFYSAQEFSSKYYFE